MNTPFNSPSCGKEVPKIKPLQRSLKAFSNNVATKVKVPMEPMRSRPSRTMTNTRNTKSHPSMPHKVHIRHVQCIVAMYPDSLTIHTKSWIENLNK